MKIIYLYRIFSTLCLPLLVALLIIRAIRKKENIRRINERLGFTRIKTSKKPIIWLHAASVGESLVAITLIDIILGIYPNQNFLLTTCTITAAETIYKKTQNKGSKGQIIHQFAPIDEYFAVARFLEYWNPSLFIMIESEIWPNILSQTTCPIILANATMSNKAFVKWSKYKAFASELLKRFSYVICQNKITEKRYRSFGVQKIAVYDNIKYISCKPGYDDTKMLAMKTEISGRITLLAASTHQGDEEIICDLHNKLKAIYPDILTIIAPRHLNRVNDILDTISRYNLTCSIRSKNENIKSSEVYLADTMGELGVFFNLSKITIMGGSFSNGGHNIIEPAFFDTTIIFGPDMRNFLGISEEFLKNNAAIQVENSNDLFEKVKSTLNQDMSYMHKNAKAILVKKRNIADKYLAIISDYIK